MIPQHPTSTLFPYTTLFRSYNEELADLYIKCLKESISAQASYGPEDRMLERSEEHTSELQSHVNLVCRLLLEKKKKHKTHSTTYPYCLSLSRNSTSLANP